MVVAKPKVSIVIPAYNEEDNLKKGVLVSVWEYLKNKNFDWEVLIVDDGSSDKTVVEASKFARGHKGFSVLEEMHRGKAGTVIAGVLASKGEVVLFTDMDQATPINQLDKLLPYFENNYDVVIGSRHGRKGAPFVRKLSAFAFSVLRRILLGLPFKDTQCGFKAFNRRAVETIFPIMKRNWDNKKAAGAAVNAGFDIEILMIAKKKGFKIAEVPVVWHHVGTERVQIVSDALEAISDMIRLMMADYRGKFS